MFSRRSLEVPPFAKMLCKLSYNTFGCVPFCSASILTKFIKACSWGFCASGNAIATLSCASIILHQSIYFPMFFSVSSSLSLSQFKQTLVSSIRHLYLLWVTVLPAGPNREVTKTMAIERFDTPVDIPDVRHVNDCIGIAHYYLLWVGLAQSINELMKRALRGIFRQIA